MIKLSIIVPVFNEEKTIEEVVKRLNEVRLVNFDKEIIIVDDGSTDKTQLKLQKIQKQFKNIIVLKHLRNQGKGATVITGIKKATGGYILIQDADLEYNPKYIGYLLKPISDKKSEVIYGTRLNRMPNLKSEEKTFQFFIHYLGNRFLSLITSILYGQWLTDMETGYKLFPRRAMEKIKLKAKGFEFEPEITSKLLKQGYKIKEIPIDVIPRGYGEGKKLNTVRDGAKALWYLFKYRLVN